MTDGDSGSGGIRSLLSEDTVGDKAVRFGCGAVLAALVFVSMVFIGLGTPFGLSEVVAVGVIIIVASGTLSVVFGERYVHQLVKLIKWLA